MFKRLRHLRLEIRSQAGHPAIAYRFTVLIAHRSEVRTRFDWICARGLTPSDRAGEICLISTWLICFTGPKRLSFSCLPLLFSWQLCPSSCNKSRRSLIYLVLQGGDREHFSRRDETRRTPPPQSRHLNNHCFFLRGSVRLSVQHRVHDRGDISGRIQR